MATVPGSGFGPPTLLGTITGDKITESSGLVASRRSPGRYWTHNDSGDGPFLYCLTDRAEPCGVVEVTGADARDWEDIAAGPGPDLYIGDIGDNLGDLASVVVYRVAEPAITIGAGRTEPAQALRLRYPDGPHDAEALLVHPQTGDVYIVVKEPMPGVYVARAPVSGSSITTMQKLGTLPIGSAGDRISLVTGGDIAPDGRRVALATYGEGYELRLPDAEQPFDTIWQQRPQAVQLGLRPQGESIAYRIDGNALLTASERPRNVPGPMYQVERVS